MADFIIPENPEYKENIRKLETTDPAHADLFNNIFQILLINQAFLKKMLETDYYEQLIGYTDKSIADLINGAPETLDTLKEVADAIKENETVVEALDAAIGTKASKADFETHAADNNIHTAGGAAQYLKVHDIAEGTNLNDIQTAGFYRCSSNAATVALGNTPTANAFFMIVGRAHGAYQEIIEYIPSPKRYMRNYYFSTGWGSWQRVYSTSDKPTPADIGALTETDLANYTGNVVISKPFFDITSGIIIDFCPDSINTMVSVRITGNGYEGYDPIDCVYQFYNYTASGYSDIIAYSGIANGSPLVLKVFRHSGRCKGWVVQSRPFQTLQIEVTFGIGGGSGKPTFTAGEMPTSGVTNLKVITPHQSYHTGRKPTYAEVGAAPGNHAWSSASYGGGTSTMFGHVRLSDAYNGNIGSAASSIGASQLALFNAYTALDNSKLPLYPQSINLGNGNDGEKNIYFYSQDGTGHKCRIYGGTHASSTGIGIQDTKNGASFFFYDDTNLRLNMGVGINQVSFAGNMFGGISLGVGKIGYNPGYSIAPYMQFSTANINFYNSNGNQIAMTTGEFRPSVSDSGGMNLGSSSGRWKQLFASTATISTSDKNLKDHVEYIKDDERYGTLFDLLEPVIYKLKNTTANDNHDRNHMGLYAQDVEENLEVAGIDISEFAVLCKDCEEIEEEYEVENDDGEIETQTRIIKTDNIIYSLRYEELIPLLIGEEQKSKQKISNLETKLTDVKAEIAELKNLINK